MTLNLLYNSFVQVENQAYTVKILLVDDISTNLISLENLLKKEEEKIEYIFAKSGEEALRIALKEEIALILMDVQMPNMNGFETTRYLRNNSKTKNIPIIFVTAIDYDTTDLVEGFEAGAVDFLFKPLHPYITKSKVNSFIRFYKQKKELENINEYVLGLNRELEERVKERTRNLTRINKDLDNFVYTASHDLKAPINNIEGLMSTFYEILKNQIDENEELSYIKKLIDDSIIRFKTSLLDLTEVAKLENEEVNDCTEVSLSNMVNEVKMVIADLINVSNAEIVENFEAIPKIYFSKKNLRSIIYNLLSNAIKYRSPDRTPQISISAVDCDSLILLSVIDNGLGIKDKDIDKVFGMFKRLHDHVEGTGVGMSIVKRIVENVGGKIEVESKVGYGSVFKVYLPYNRSVLPLFK